jgi:phenylacetate-CoA ligase
MRPPGERLVATSRSTGSSGLPVAIERGPDAIGFAAAARLRQLSWWGLPAVELPMVNAITRIRPDSPVVRRASDDPVRFLVNAYRLDPVGVAAAHAEIEAAGGVALLGAVTSIVEQWAGVYRDSALDAAELGLRLVVVGGDITVASQRRAIESGFGCPTAEMYGSIEAPMIATECAHGSLHINEEIVHVEVLGPDGSSAPEGVLGEVVVTPLHNHELPLLRYRLMDAAALLPGRCACGRTLRRLDMRVGRLEEMVVLPDGSLLHSGCFRNALEWSLGPSLRMFHTIQVDRRRFVSYVEMADGEIPKGVHSLVEAEISRYMQTPVSVELVHDAHRARATLAGHKRTTFTRRVA